MSEETGIIRREERSLSDAMTAAEIRAQVNRIQEVMKAVMKNGTHYGTVPGCGDKPTLLKPGAEKILSTFHIAVDPQVDSEIRTDDEYTVRIKAAASCGGRELGAAFGEASTMEEKYKWRRAICDEEFNETPEDRRREAFKKYQGKVTRIKQIRTQVSDIANTVLKMAVKRAEVAVCLKVTAASDIFTQDIEDLPEGMVVIEEQGPPPVNMPSRKSEAQPPPATKPADGEQAVPAGNEARGVVSRISKKTTSTGKMRYGVCLQTDAGDQWFNTFSEADAQIAEELSHSLALTLISYKETRYGKDIIAIGKDDERGKTDDAEKSADNNADNNDEIPLPFK